MSTFKEWWEKECTPYIKSGLADKEIAVAIWNAACLSCSDEIAYNVKMACETPTGDDAVSREAASDACMKLQGS
jgi:hypothetical protein